MKPEPRAVLFNLAADPEELHDLSSAEPNLAQTLQGLLDAKRAESAAGVHLRFASARTSSEPVTVRARLRVEGGQLGDLVGIELEDEDEFSVDPVTGVIELALVLRGTSRQNTARQRSQQDFDEVIVRMTPPQARLVIEQVEGLTGPVMARGESLGEDPWPLTLAADAVDWPAPPTQQRGGRKTVDAFIWVHAAPELHPIPEDLSRRMEALGYAGDD